MTLLLAMFSFSLVMSISPGPVNMIIVSSGINYGAKRTFPYVSGATIGFTLLLLFIGFGFFQVTQNYPAFFTVLAVAGALFIINMGYKLAISKPEFKLSYNKIPKFYEGFLLQWLNPKAWIACVSGVSLFSSPESYQPLLTFVLIYFLVCYACLGAWAILGDKISILFHNHTRLKAFNVFMGGLLIVTAIYLLANQFLA